jgi:hypothetical protein
MTLTMNGLLAMVWRTVRNPREGAEELLSIGVPREALWPALVLVVVLSILLAQGTTLLMTGSADMSMPVGPAATGFIQLLLLVVMVFAIFWIGRSMGGTGSFEEAILLVAWLQFVMVCVQALQALALVLFPTVVATLIGIAALALFLWLLTNFIAVLHGFSSLLLVFVMILVSAFGLAFGLSLILTLIGVTVPVVQGS